MHNLLPTHTSTLAGVYCTHVSSHENDADRHTLSLSLFHTHSHCITHCLDASWCLAGTRTAHTHIHHPTGPKIDENCAPLELHFRLCVCLGGWSPKFVLFCFLLFFFFFFYSGLTGCTRTVTGLPLVVPLPVAGIALSLPPVKSASTGTHALTSRTFHLSCMRL